MQQKLTSDTGTTLNLETNNFYLPSFSWCFAYTDKDNVLTTYSTVVTCKDYLIDMLNKPRNLSLIHDKEIPRDTPITLLVFLPKTNASATFKQGISNLLNPLERKYKWKQTDCEDLGIFNIKSMYGDKLYFQVIKITASKMWKRNPFLFSIWSSLLRLSHYYPDSTLDTFIGNCYESIDRVPNETQYIKSNVNYFGLESYKAKWQEILNSLHQYKDFYGSYMNSNIRFHTHGNDGIFWCFLAPFLYTHDQMGLKAAKESHPYINKVLAGLKHDGLRYAA